LNCTTDEHTLPLPLWWRCIGTFVGFAPRHTTTQRILLRCCHAFHYLVDGVTGATTLQPLHCAFNAYDCLFTATCVTAYSLMLITCGCRTRTHVTDSNTGISPTRAVLFVRLVARSYALPTFYYVRFTGTVPVYHFVDYYHTDRYLFRYVPRYVDVCYRAFLLLNMIVTCCSRNVTCSLRFPKFTLHAYLTPIAVIFRCLCCDTDIVVPHGGYVCDHRYCRFHCDCLRLRFAAATVCTRSTTRCLHHVVFYDYTVVCSLDSSVRLTTCAR